MPDTSRAAGASPLVNDFNIQVATVNGTGSQSANSVLMRTIFNMGVPVAGKNVFPSNIQGLPTWFTIRVSKDGYTALRKDSDVLVAMNPQTVHDDIRALQPGKVVVYNASLPVSEESRTDLHYYKCPFDAMADKVADNAKLKKLVVNMIYVGVLAEMMGMAMPALERALRQQFKGKEKAVAINLEAVKLGIAYAKENFAGRYPPFRVEPMDRTKDLVIIDGNTASALGCMFAGCTVFSWYPITPASSLGEAVIEYFGRFRKEKDGTGNYAVIQAEDELAAAGMAFGAGWAGARAATSTSGPGLSLMSEFIGLGYFAEIPAVFFDVQRVGPSTGLPTRTMQGDILMVYSLSHGDTQHIALFPCSMEECFRMAQDAFNLADRFQTPVFVLTDLDLGMNNWMSKPFDYPKDIALDRGKVLDATALAKVKSFGRYKDVDGDGIPYRTLPGNEHPLAPYFTRGSGHDENARYTESPTAYTDLMDRLKRKIQNSRDTVPQPVVESDSKGKAGLLAFGSTHCAMMESLDQLRTKGQEPAYMRLRALPVNGKVEDFIRSHERVYVVEQNRDAQMRQVLSACYPALASKLRSILHYDGFPVDAATITESFLAQEK
jgi:2-oxoglutarate ferredoxin oxidoreductase subunit alpha